MKIVVTGSKGFLGRNLLYELKNRGYSEVFGFDRGDDKAVLSDYLKGCGFVFHLAGVNRPDDEKEFMGVNRGFTGELVELLLSAGSRAPLLFSSSIQAGLENPYGKSKKAAEKIVFEYGKRAPAYVYRLSNLFGKWSKPDYNTVVATFCYNIARGLPVKVDDAAAELSLCYIDDALDEFMRALSGNPSREGDFCRVPEVYSIRLGELESLIRGFGEERKSFSLPDMGDGLTRKLYSTYLSFLPEDGFSYGLKKHSDGNGLFAEFLRMRGMGQVSVNVMEPGVVRGNHWHRSKAEKFLVVEGKALIKLRRVDSEKITEYSAGGDCLRVVEIPPGYTHTIKNVSGGRLVTLMWASEVFNPDKPDTYPMEL